MEAETLHDIVVHPGQEPSCNGKDIQIVALGGGTVMTPECAELVHEKTLCVYLRASAETLVRNLEGEAEGRPMLASGEPLNIRIATLMAQRSDTYEKTAHIIIDTDGKSIEEIAGIIKESI
jgi:shikimate kinase